MKLVPHITKLVALAVACSLNMAPRAAAAEGTVQDRLIPTALLVANPGSSEYPLPTCKSCKLLKLETQTTTSGRTQGVLTVVYHDEENSTFEGAIELTVVLVDGAEYVVLIEEVVLTEGEEAGWVIDEEVGTWGWDKVDMVRMELVAG